MATEDQEGRPLTALHCVLRHARSLEGIQATGTPALTDQALQNVLDEANPLKDLRRFILTEAAGSNKIDCHTVVGDQNCMKRKKIIVILFLHSAERPYGGRGS